MNKGTIRILCAVAVLSASSCARTGTTGKNDAAQRYFDAWVGNQSELHKEFLWKSTELGSRVLIHTQTQGNLAGDQDGAPYVLMDYTVSSIGNRLSKSDSPGKYFWGDEVGDNTDSLVAIQIGAYDKSYFYGPQVWQRKNNGLSVGLDEIIAGMREGERVWAVIPGWLQGTTRRSSVAAYLANDTGAGAPLAYDIVLRKIIPDVNEYQLDSIKKYLSANYPQKAYDDTTATGWGCYYIRAKEPESTKEFPSDTTVYINYTGRLLNGQVFDTTIADTAKVWNVYSPYKTYNPVSVGWGATYDKLTMNGSSVIAGFAKGLFQMHKFEKGTVVFYSGLGYGASGSAPRIPSFSPLAFEIELVSKPQS